MSQLLPATPLLASRGCSASGQGVEVALEGLTLYQSPTLLRTSLPASSVHDLVQIPRRWAFSLPSSEPPWPFTHSYV